MMRLFGTARTLVCGLLGGFLVLASAGAAPAQQQWGTIKGRVVYGGDKVPDPIVLKVDKDQKECLADKKQLTSEEWVIDPKTKGIKWVFVYLIPDSRNAADIVKPIPIHPDRQKKAEEEKKKNVVIDQPCCTFTPFAVGLLDGQSVTFKNSMDISHNVKVDGNATFKNPTINQLIPAKGSIDVGPFHPQPTPIPLACNIHSWMSGYIRVFSHPYFCVTKEDGTFEIKDAPAGKYRLVIWHPGSGWVVGDKEPDKFGKQIEIMPPSKSAEATDLGQFKVMPPK
jgi:plastocyanin